MTIKRTDLEGARKIPLMFNAESMGQSLREVAVDVVPVENIHYLSRWFHSPNDIDLFIWTDEKRSIIRHQVSFYGQVVEWNVLDGVKTGFIIEQEVPDSESSETIQFDVHPQSSAVNQAMQLLENVTELAGLERNQLIELLRSPITRKDDSVVALLEHLKSDLRQTQRPGFWKRVKRWFSGS